MIALRGTYADECNGPLPDRDLHFVCRLFRYKDTYYDGVGNVVVLEDGDVLLVCGQATWFALFRPLVPTTVVPTRTDLISDSVLRMKDDADAEFNGEGAVSFSHDPAHGIGTCQQCGGEMVYNVPRMGPAGGFVHKGTGTYECPPRVITYEPPKVQPA